MAEEAAQTAEFFGSYVDRIYDVGVPASPAAGPAGADPEGQLRGGGGRNGGGLGTVIVGLVENPVIAVPTSVGYGANFKGLSPS